MRHKRYSPEKIIGMLREAEVALAQGMTIGAICPQLPMIFWGPLTGPGVVKKHEVVNYFFTDLDPDGCLAADHHEGACHTLEKPGADEQTGYFRAGW